MKESMNHRHLLTKQDCNIENVGSSLSSAARLDQGAIISSSKQTSQPKPRCFAVDQNGMKNNVYFTEGNTTKLDNGASTKTFLETCGGGISPDREMNQEHTLVTGWVT